MFLTFRRFIFFFDYDFQNKNLPPDELNKQIKELFKFFNDDNHDENISLYINYPMVESIRCTGELPDADFLYYEVLREDCRNFKGYVQKRFRFYGSLDFIELPLDKKTGEIIDARRLGTVKKNWEYLKTQNIEKANYICTGNRGLPSRKDDVCQTLIFENQIEKYVKPKDSVAILNAFPLFLYEYFR